MQADQYLFLASFVAVWDSCRAFIHTHHLWCRQGGQDEVFVMITEERHGAWIL
jgi:hypothetical protein